MLYTRDITIVLMYMSISVRSFLYVYKDKFYGNWLPIVAIIVQLVLGCATIENPLHILAIVLPCFVCWYMWFWQDDKQKIRFGNVINNGGWGIYNALTGLWIVVIMRVFVVACNAVSIYRTSKEQSSRSEETPMFDENAASEA